MYFMRTNYEYFKILIFTFTTKKSPIELFTRLHYIITLKQTERSI
jgi:hypothetical protein